MSSLIAISYKENHTDTCMSCVMERFDSAFEINSGTEDEVLSRLVALEMDLEARDGCYDHYFVIEGCIIGDGEFHTVRDTKEHTRERIEAKQQELLNKLREMLATANDARKKAKEKEKVETAKREEARKRSHDLEMLQQLKKKYPDEGDPKCLQGTV